MNPAHPSLDDRYPVGHCVSCTPWPKPKEHPFKPNKWIQPPRKTIALIRSDLFDRERHERRMLVEHKRKLARRLDGKRRLSEAEWREASDAAAWLREN